MQAVFVTVFVRLQHGRAPTMFSQQCILPFPAPNSKEVYLWHGTNVRAALSIAQNDFSIDLAGSSTGTMYLGARGNDAYFEQTASDSYAF